MARATGAHPAILEAIRALGLNPNDVLRLSVDIGDNAPVMLRVELFADATRTAALLAAVKSTGYYAVEIDQHTEVEVTPDPPVSVEQWQAIRASGRDCLVQTTGNLVDPSDSHECRHPADHGVLPHRCACGYEWPGERVEPAS